MLLTFSVFSPELDDWIDVRLLSQGTLDQLYLCARLGIVRQVTEPGAPPLLFDDPFVTFDTDRAERALAMLKDLARELQVIFFTTTDRFDALADNVVVLATPQARDEPEPAVAASTGEAISMWSSTSLPAVAAAATPDESAGNGQVAANGTPAPVVPATTTEPPAPVAPLWPEER